MGLLIGFGWGSKLSFNVTRIWGKIMPGRYSSTM
jgi:hypothetical protein